MPVAKSLAPWRRLVIREYVPKYLWRHLYQHARPTALNESAVSEKRGGAELKGKKKKRGYPAPLDPTGCKPSARPPSYNLKSFRERLCGSNLEHLDFDSVRALSS